MSGDIPERLNGPLGRRTDWALPALACAALAALLAPIPQYALDTPIGLLERAQPLGYKFNSAGDFLQYLRSLLEPQPRFRPFYDIWQGLIWKVFGDLAWPHHLIRWLVHCGAFAFFLAAFARIARLPQAAGASPGQLGLRIIPAVLLAYIWLLFPNLPAVRIAPQELYTIFFLGLCNWAAALMLSAKNGKPSQHALFCLGWLGLLFSKEPNVAPALWLLAFWLALAVAKGAAAKKLPAKAALMGGGAAMALTLFFVITKLSETLGRAEEGEAYFNLSKPILDRFTENSTAILRELFQYETSLVITAAFAFLLAALVAAVVAKIARREFNAELAFVILLLGELASMFLVLSIQYDVTLRYWSVLVPCLATLLAFAAKFLLAGAKPHKALANCTALALAAFIAFFAAANYYNFLYQIVIQHSARNLDELALPEVARLINGGKYVQANSYDLGYEEITRLNTNYVRESYWPNSPYDSGRVQLSPPEDPAQPYYLVDILDNRGQPALEEITHASWVGRTDYGILGAARKLAGLLQGSAPHESEDWGMFPLGEYRWAIYALPRNMGGYLTQLAKELGEPVAQSVFDLHLDGNRLIYVKKPCAERDVKDGFFLHLVPVRTSDLPEHRKQHGFDNLDFDFRRQGITGDGGCLAVRRLPQYAIARIATGQFLRADGRQIWSAEIPIQN